MNDSVLTELLSFEQSKQTTAKFGKTFYFASWFMGKHTAERAYRLYHVCRRLDDIADQADRDNSETLLAIQNYLEQQSSAGQLDIGDQVLLPSIAIKHLLDGFIFDQDVPQIDTEGDLLRYCYQVAGTVGIMMCSVLEVDDPRAIAHAIDLGIAMQLTNIARDIAEDATMGRRYVPNDWIGGLTSEKIKQQIGQSQHRVIAQAQEKLLNTAERYYQSGFAGLHYLPENVRFSIYLAAQCYRNIGEQINKQQCWFTRAVVPLPKKLLITAKSWRQYRAQQQTENLAHPHQCNLHHAIADYAQTGTSDYEPL